jgi:hypothetical protein
MDYFSYNARRLKPKKEPEPVTDDTAIRKYDSVDLPDMQVTEGKISDTFIGRLQRFWERR